MTSPLASAFREVAADLESQWAEEEGRDRLVSQRERYRNDPVAYCREVLGFHPWSKQQQILESVRDHKRTAVRSGNGTGKTSVAGRTVLWYLDTFQPCKVITTAPTWGQVKGQLWREIRAGYHRGRGYPKGALSETKLEFGDEWFAVGVSTDEEERLRGYHAENLLVLVDEASGVARPIYDAIQTLMTTAGAKLLLIGNPTQNVGEFYDAFHSKRALYATIAISCLETPAFTGEAVHDDVRRHLVTREWVEDHRLVWGEDSPPFEVNVLGQFSTKTDDTVIALTDVEAAHARVAELHGYHVPRVVACDVARFGSDETVIVRRCGQVARIAETYVGKDTTQTAGAILRHARALDDVPGHDVTIVVDDAGVGGGVTDQLRGCGFRVIAFNGGQRAHDESEYPNRRSEAWFSFADLLPELDLDNDDQLAADLVAPKYKLDSRGRRVLEPKDDTKKRLGRSPDRGDAIVMAFAPSPPAHFDVDRPEGERPGVLDPGLSYGMTF